MKKMKRENLEHIIRAASAITNEDEIVVVGSQSILGAFPNAPSVLLMSQEADIYPLHSPEKADLIEGSIGELSLFDKYFGYYAQGVGPETAVLPKGWEQRVIKIQNQNTDNRIGYCLDPVDLAVSKLIAYRPKDLDFVENLCQHKLITYSDLFQRLKEVTLSSEKSQKIERWLFLQENKIKKYHQKI